MDSDPNLDNQRLRLSDSSDSWLNILCNISYNSIDNLINSCLFPHKDNKD